MTTANFTYTPNEGDNPLTVYFTDTSTGSPLTWSWDFGDTFTSNEQNPVHGYSYAGIYTVSLTITDISGTYTVKKYDIITVNFVMSLNKINYVSVAPSVLTLDVSIPDDHAALKYMAEQGTGSISFFKNSEGVRYSIPNTAISVENSGFKRTNGPTILFD